MANGPPAMNWGPMVRAARTCGPKLGVALRHEDGVVSVPAPTLPATRSCPSGATPPRQLALDVRHGVVDDGEHSSIVRPSDRSRARASSRALTGKTLRASSLGDQRRTRRRLARSRPRARRRRPRPTDHPSPAPRTRTSRGFGAGTDRGPTEARRASWKIRPILQLSGRPSFWTPTPSVAPTRTAYPMPSRVSAAVPPLGVHTGRDRCEPESSDPHVRSFLALDLSEWDDREGHAFAAGSKEAMPTTDPQPNVPRRSRN